MWHDKITCSIVGHKLNFWFNSFRLQNRNAQRECTIRQSLYPSTLHIYRTIVFMTDCMLFAGLSPASFLAKQGLPRVFILASAKKETKLTYLHRRQQELSISLLYLYTSAGLILFPFFFCRLLPCRGEIRNARHHVPSAARCLDSLPYSLRSDQTILLKRGGLFPK